LIETTTKRLEISAFLTEFLVSAIERSPNELLKVIYLCINRVCRGVAPTHSATFAAEDVYVQICPDYEGLELGIGESLLIKAISESTGRNANLLKADYRKTGDLGLVAQVADPLFNASFSLAELGRVVEFAEQAAYDVQTEETHGRQCLQ
jgi:DNA ligase-1